VVVFFVLAPLLLTRLGLYGYISVDKWRQTTRRKRKEYQAAQSVEAILEEVSYKLGDDGELVKGESSEIQDTKERKTRL
jgi:hypothetical protein